MDLVVWQHGDLTVVFKITDLPPLLSVPGDVVVKLGKFLFQIALLYNIHMYGAVLLVQH